MAQKAAKFKVTTKGSALVRVRVDDVRLRFDQEGKAEKNLTTGQNHLMQWFVRGAPGAKYTVEITSPVEARFSHTGTLDMDQMDSGDVWFWLA